MKRALTPPQHLYLGGGMQGAVSLGGDKYSEFRSALIDYCKTSTLTKAVKVVVCDIENKLFKNNKTIPDTEDYAFNFMVLNTCHYFDSS